MTKFRDGAGKLGDKTRASYSTESYEELKKTKGQGQLRGHRSQPERAPNGQNWNNLRNKANNYSTRPYNPKNKINSVSS